jgi:hypothetical protein
MKRTAIVLALTLGLAACGDDDSPTGPSNTGPIVFTAQLSSQNEVPPVTNAEAPARGSVTITFNVPRDGSGNPTGGGTATFAIQLNSFPNGSAAILAHIHGPNGPAGQNAGVFVNTGLSAAAPIGIATGSASQTISNVNITQDQATQVFANPGNFYFNVHTPVNPGGAVRGQLSRQQ